MPSNPLALLDAQALAIVLLGTVLATALRCGWRESVGGLRAALALASRGFDAGANRAALARTARSIDELGYLRSDAPPPPDRELALLLDDVLAAGSAKGVQAAARTQRSRREGARRAACQVFESAGELAPVFGLAGTLFAITRLVPETGLTAAETTMASVATAVLSSLYGVLLAHLVCLPLAHAIERRQARDERERAEALDWFENALGGARHGRGKGHRAPLRGVA